MLTILHGDNIVLSRAELVRLREAHKDKEIRTIDGKHCDENMLRQALESSSLFQESLVVIIENLFANLGRKQKEGKHIAGIIEEAGKTIDIVLWESKELGKTVPGYFPKANVRLFKTPAIIFEFLDSINPNAKKQTLELLTRLLATEPPELVLYMIESRIRQLIQVKDGSGGAMSPWQRSRLTNQAKFFTMDKLLMMHTTIADLEFSLKTGTTPMTLSELITQYIIEL